MDRLSHEIEKNIRKTRCLSVAEVPSAINEQVKVTKHRETSYSKSKYRIRPFKRTENERCGCSASGRSQEMHMHTCITMPLSRLPVVHERANENLLYSLDQSRQMKTKITLNNIVNWMFEVGLWIMKTVSRHNNCNELQYCPQNSLYSVQWNSKNKIALRISYPFIIHSSKLFQ